MAELDKIKTKIKGGGNFITRDVEIVPRSLFALAFMISFALPNLVFSGRHFFDTLHIMKWTVTMVPVAVLCALVGIKLALYGAGKYDFRLDLFSFGWIALMLVIIAQPFYLPISSVSTFAKEYFYFACLFAVYFLSYNLFKSDRLHRAILWGGNVNAFINVIFAEMLIRNLNSPYPFILDVPGNYIGNTAQQEMFGLWMAMSVFNGIFVHLDIVDRLKTGEKIYKRADAIVNIAILLVNSWGLWSSTARGGILSLAVAFVVLVICLWKTGRKTALRSSFKMIAAVIALVVIVLGVSSTLGTGRGSSLMGKMGDMITNTSSIGGRASIWKTSVEVFLKSPIFGVGLGQYKWNFLDAQRIMYEKYPELYDRPGYSWQFTYWAHSEYLQWASEVGIIGTIILFLMGVLWLYSFAVALIKGQDLPSEAVWGIAMVFLLWFDALFSRPFHRIENSVWMSLAFALSNRSIMSWVKINTAKISDNIYRVFGVAAVGASLYGLYFLAGGIYGDQMIFKAITQPGTAIEKQDLLRAAEAQLMSMDDAREQYADLLVKVGKAQNSDEIKKFGMTKMYEAYMRRPTSKLLFDVLGVAQELNDQEMLRELTRYLSPSMYKIQTAE